MTTLWFPCAVNNAKVIRFRLHKNDRRVCHESTAANYRSICKNYCRIRLSLRHVHQHGRHAYGIRGGYEINLTLAVLSPYDITSSWKKLAAPHSMYLDQMKTSHGLLIN